MSHNVSVLPSACSRRHSTGFPAASVANPSRLIRSSSRIRSYSLARAKLRAITATPPSNRGHKAACSRLLPSPRGDVSIACVPTIGVRYLPRVIHEYSARYPDNRIKILDHSSFGVADAVLRREAEFGINVAGSHDAGLVSVPLLRDRFVLICRDDHPLAQHKRASWSQLEPHPLIFAGHVSGNRPLLDLALAADSPRLRAYYEVQRSSTALGLVAEGVGAAVVPSLAVQRDAYPRIRVVALVAPVVSRSLVVISPRNSQLSPAAQALYDMLVRHAVRGAKKRGRSQ